ncbi:unnamed protein product, partial [Mesorhabditis belari]|uniref:NADH dehydrogenase [ubiquinone] 1 alpha subcomplex subunit 5 n=1 Tax=Mesorhabditis belari TaxID=2138241 RepID=A0AAF3F5J0_9BILA
MTSRLLPRSLSMTSIRTMYENPYVKRFKAKTKVSPDYHKQSTGLTGLFVEEHPHRALSVVYGRLLRALEKLPKDYAYRKYTEQVVRHRLNLVQTETDVLQLEQKIGMGQVEEVLQQAQFELETTRALF